MAIQSTPTLDAKQKRFKGSLAGTLVRTLLIFTFIPLALMAGGAYIRARALLRNQAVVQSQNLLLSQVKTINREVANKESSLAHLLESSDFKILVEIALHANPQSNEFNKIRNSVMQEFNALNAQDNNPAFSQFILLDANGQIKIASNAALQGTTIDHAIIERRTEDSHSVILYGLPPIYENEFILVTALDYKTERGSKLGTILGITEKENLQTLIQPLNSLYPLASTYFITSNNQFIYSNPETGELTRIESPSVSQVDITNRLSQLILTKSQDPVAMDTTTASGKVGLVQMQWFPTLQAGIILEMESSNIYGEIASLAPFTIAITLGALVATGLALIIGINRVIKPLRSLSDITRGFAQGNWDQRAEVLSNDEVGLLADSFNNMAGELGDLYRSLEQKVDERTRQIRIAAEVARNITSLSDLDEILKKTVESLVNQFGYYQASIFMVNRAGKYLEYKAGYGAATVGLAAKMYRLDVGSASIMGWVSANNQSRIASDVLEDPLHLKNELLPETRSEATVPISIGSLVLGVLDVQSVQPGIFNSETVVMLQTIASQIAAAIQTISLTETSSVNFDELSRLHRSSRLISRANHEEEIFKISEEVLKESPYSVAILRVNGQKLETFSASNENGESVLSRIPTSIDMDAMEIERFMDDGPVITDSTTTRLPDPLRAFAEPLQLTSVAYIPASRENILKAIIMIGSAKQPLNNAILQPYINFVELISVAFEKTWAIQQTERHLREVESLASVNEAISTSSDLNAFFIVLHNKIQQIIGDYSLIVALYDEKNNAISIPFSYEDGAIAEVESFPLGEGLTSILIRSRQPLLISENTERRAAELGAKIIGKPAKSWMGAPMIVQNKPIGAIIIQDIENEKSFNEDDLKFLTALTGQVAGLINNIHLLNESQHRALQLETAAEIARDISGSLNLDELLIKAVNFIRERFNFYHAAVFLHDLPNEFAVIREATGEAGAQMKRAGHKIGIGSKSIVGFVSSRGEQLVVNDVVNDATYYPNPLLPDTRAEAAIPLKVGDRILGEIDVQSSKPFVFLEDNLRSLQILADQIAIAVVNTELFAETQEHLSQHRLLHHITTTAASGKTLEEALESAVNGLQVTLGGDRVTILLADREKKKLEIKASIGYAEDVTKVEIPIGTGITGWVAAHRRSLRIRNVEEDSRYVQVSSNTRSELAIPLVYRNELLGVLNVESEHVDAYTENDEEMLGTLGGSLAAIIANARLLEQVRLQAERERLIYDITSKIRRSTDIQSILNTTASELTRITGASFTRLQIKPAKDNNQEGS